MKKLVLLLVSIAFFHSLLSAQEADSLKFPVNLTVEQFKQRILNKNKMVLVNFSADWCLMCKKQKPILDELLIEKKKVLELMIIDMDDNPLIAEYFNVDGLPINLLYKNGILVWDRAGIKTKAELLTQIGYFE